jgi:uncharacterized membrane protein YgdD (TMEM256/DUF423 family)
MSPARTVGLLGAALGLSGVVLAALGSHAVPGMDDPSNYRSWQAASLLHLVHAVALLALGVQLRRQPGRAILVAALLLVAGVVLFSGSIYARVALDLGRTFNIAPLGGLLLMVGWCVCLYALLRGD